MNFVCALLLLFLEEEDAFWLLSTLVEDITNVEETDTQTETETCGETMEGV